MERDGVRWLMEDGQVHSRFDPAEPLALSFDYLQLLAVALDAFAPQRGRVLVVGLGGGTLCRWLGVHRPHLQRVAVEHARPVVRLARRYFALESAIEVHVDDGRAFVETHRDFDVIVLDASSEDYVPPHLATVEFFRQCVAPLVLMNSWDGAPRADDEWASWQAAFPHATLLRHGTPNQANRVLVGGAGVPSELDVQRARVDASAARLGFVATSHRPEVRGQLVHDA